MDPIDYRSFNIINEKTTEFDLDSKFILNDALPLLDPAIPIDADIIEVGPAEHKQEYTEKELQEQLSDFICIPREYWPRIDTGDCIRWVSAGKLHSCVYVLKNWKRAKKSYFHVSKNNTQVGSWNILHDNIEILYKKVNKCCYLELSLLQANIVSLYEDIKKLKSKIKKLNKK